MTQHAPSMRPLRRSFSLHLPSSDRLARGGERRPLRGRAFVVAASFSLLGVACSSQTPPPQPPQTASTEAVPAPPDEDCVETEEVQRTLAARRHGILACYADAVALDPMLRGTVTLAFVIPPSGKVERVDIAQSDLENEALHACITKVASGMEFAQETCSLPRDIEYSVRLKRGSSEFVSSID